MGLLRPSTAIATISSMLCVLIGLPATLYVIGPPPQGAAAGAEAALLAIEPAHKPVMSPHGLRSATHPQAAPLLPVVKARGSTAEPSNDGPCKRACTGFAKADAEAIMKMHSMTLPRCCASDGLSSEWMADATSANKSVLDYLYPPSPRDAWKSGSIESVWRPVSRSCRLVPAACYCFHVKGSPIKAENPDAWRDSVSIANNPSGKRKCELCKNFNNCSCLAPSKRGAAGISGMSTQPVPGCLFGDMRPGKLLAVIGACRRLGITHIIEEGRYGGLSAYVYALHGFKVTSVELLPIDFVASALRESAPSIVHAVGDGSVLVPELVRKASHTERLAVIFDGEKRHKAYRTYKKISDRVHLAIFDDSFHERFHNFLDSHRETAWHTNLDSAFLGAHGPVQDLEQLRPFETTLRHAATSLMRQRPELTAQKGPLKKERERLIDERGRLNLPPGGLQSMAYYHFVLVRGGAWKDGDELW